MAGPPKRIRAKSYNGRDRRTQNPNRQEARLDLNVHGSYDELLRQTGHLPDNSLHPAKFDLWTKKHELNLKNKSAARAKVGGKPGRHFVPRAGNMPESLVKSGELTVQGTIHISPSSEVIRRTSAISFGGQGSHITNPSGYSIDVHPDRRMRASKKKK